MAKTNYSPVTIIRTLEAIRAQHADVGLASPTESEAVRDVLKELARNQRTHLRGPGNAETTPLTSKDLDAIYGTAFIPRPRGRGHETPELAVIRALRLPACQGPTRGPDSAASDQGDDFKAGNAVPGQKYGSSADGSSLPRSHWAPAILAGALSAPPEIGVGYPRPSGDALTCVRQVAAPLADVPFLTPDAASPPIVGVAVGVDSQNRLSSRVCKAEMGVLCQKDRDLQGVGLIAFSHGFTGLQSAGSALLKRKSALVR